MNRPIVAVIGLGAMGMPMARHLASTFDVRTFDVDGSKESVASEFSQFCHSARAAAKGADIALLAVRNHQQLVEALWGTDGITEVLPHGAVVLVTSTVGIEAVRNVAEQLEAQALVLVDAPVSGGPARAGNGDLLVTVGAEPIAYEKALPVLDAMSSTLKWVGKKPGDGQSMKTVNQLLCGVHIAAAAEALALARTLGLNPEAALETLMAGAAASFMLGDRGPRMLQAYDEGRAEVKSRLDIFVKDMGIVTAAARENALATPLAAVAHQQYLIGQAHGLASSDDSSVIKVIDMDGPAKVA